MGSAYLLPVWPSLLPKTGHRASLLIDCKSMVKFCILVVFEIMFSYFLWVCQDGAGIRHCWCLPFINIVINLKVWLPQSLVGDLITVDHKSSL